MVEGESGILAISPPDNMPTYEPSKRRLTWPNGAIATTFTADEPSLLRGPQHDRAWCDELASWRYLEAWDNLMLGLRLGANPQCIVTTTPKPRRLLREIAKAPTTYVTQGSTYDNQENLAEGFFRDIVAKYEGTTVGRQEIYAELLDEMPGALWTRALIDANRVREAPSLRRVVVAVDPAVTATEESDETGICVAGLGENKDWYVLEDLSGRWTPDTWAKRAVASYDKWKADRIIGEANNGGDLVEATIRTVSPTVAYTKVHASRGKRARAEPIAALDEQGRVHHVGVFPELEDEMCSWVSTSNDPSPSRMDARVWALTELSRNTFPLIDMNDKGLTRKPAWRV
jgi:phage terminase large subunit-like protein